MKIFKSLIVLPLILLFGCAGLKNIPVQCEEEFGSDFVNLQKCKRKFYNIERDFKELEEYKKYLIKEHFEEIPIMLQETFKVCEADALKHDSPGNSQTIYYSERVCLKYQIKAAKKLGKI